jgi:chemotaxis protein methyltransferase CheR/two-component system CheB/CheR fusion protein
MKEKISDIIDVIATFYNADISGYDHAFVERAIKNRMSVFHLNHEQDYFKILEQNPDEGKLFISSLQVNVSEFFRNPLTFTYLKQVILPWIIEKKKLEKEKEIRIWSAACSEGQEPYSIAIIWKELASSLQTDTTCRIFATDINQESINIAKEGIYNESMLKKASLNQVNSYFLQNKNSYTIHPKIKKLVSFSEFDLLTEKCICPPESIFGNFDVVICSNLLFYFQQINRQRIIDKVGHCLANGGYFITGETEREIIFHYNYREVFPYSAIFQSIRNQKDRTFIDPETKL